MLLGVDLGRVVAAHYGLFGAIGTSAAALWDVGSSTVTYYVKAVTSSKVRKKLQSVVGITQDTQQAVSRGPGFFLVLMALVSLVLAVVNLFPFLPLDGGHVVWSLAEKVRGKRVSLRRDVALQPAGRPAARVPRAQRHRQRHQPPQRLSGARTHTQLFVSGPNRSGSAGPNSALELGAAEQRDVLPVAGRAETPVPAAQRRRQPVRARQQRVRLDRERARRRLHVPAARDAAQLGGERRPALARHVLDHARAVREVELAVGEREPLASRRRARTAPGSRGARRGRRR